MDLFSKRYRKKNTRTIEEQNQENEKNWKKFGISPSEEIKNKIVLKEVQKRIKEFKKANVDEEYIKNYLFSHLPERMKLDGKFVWICRVCQNGKKFDSKEEYIKHTLSKHG